MGTTFIDKIEVTKKQPKLPLMFTNEFDVAQFTGQVHTPLREDNIINEDFKLAVFDEKEREFIMDQINLASISKSKLHRAYGELAGNWIFNHYTLTPQLHAVLKANVKNNPMITMLLKSTLTHHEDEEEEEPIKRKKRKVKKERDDDEDED